MKLAFSIGYKGDDFAGSQAQPGKRTIEGEFIAAGVGLGLFTDAKEAHFRISGRTDKGVSARKQIISITTNHPKKAIDALNFWLPDDIWCMGVAEVPADFHPRYAVTSRTYRYYFPYPANIAAMEAIARQFIGRHNFTRFSKMDERRDPNRTVTEARVFAAPDGCPVFEVAAKSFLWNMVRGMAGFLALFAAEMATSEMMDDLMTKPGPRVHPAPAEPLILWDMMCDVSFMPIRQAKETMRMLGQASVTARTKLHVSEALMNEPPEEIWRWWLMRKYPDLWQRSK